MICNSIHIYIYTVLFHSCSDGDEKDLVIQAAVESWIEPTQIVQQTVSAEKINIQPIALEKCLEVSHEFNFR